MRLGINDVLTHETPEQWAEILNAKGLRAASFPVNYEAPDALIQAYEKAFRDYDIMIAEVGIWNSPFCPDKKQAEKNREICRRQLELAEYIQAKCCVNVSGSAGDCWYGCYPENYSMNMYQRNIEFAQYLLDTVQPKHTYYTLEIMQWMVPDSAESYQRFIRDVDRERMAVHFDPVNLVNSAKKAMFYPKYRDEAIDLLASEIKSCHIKDFDIRQELTVQIYETIPGTGRADITKYIEKVDAIDKEMPMLVEHLNGWEEYDRAFSYLKNMEVKLNNCFV